MTSDPVQDLLHCCPRFATWPVVDALGQRMLAAGKDGDWALALKILGERNVLLERFFAEPVTEDEAPEVAEAVQRTLDHDAELRRLSEGGRADLQEKLRNVKLGRKARDAYLSGP